MPDEEVVEQFTTCLKGMKNSFTTYDQAVDVISCLELFFEDGYRGRIDCFDRFPRFKDPELTPDATVLFNNGYGVVIELKRTFPENAEGFLKDIKQVKSYDVELAFRRHDGSTAVPEVMDIVLLIKADNANEIFIRFRRVCEENEITFTNNLVFMEYYYDSSNTVEKYVVRKWMGDNRPFRDSLGGDGLEALLGIEAKSIMVPPDRAMEKKLTRVFINDQPPEIYTVVFLWTRVLYNFLTEEQKEQWRIGGHDRTHSIDVEIDGLVEFINDEIIDHGRVRRQWIVKAIGFLKSCELASDLADGKVRVNYRNLRQMVGSRKYASDGQQEVDRVRDLGSYFADLYCRRLVETKDEPPEETAVPQGELSQRSLTDF